MHQREGAQIQAKKRKAQSKQAAEAKEQEQKLYMSRLELQKQVIESGKTDRYPSTHWKHSKFMMQYVLQKRNGKPQMCIASTIEKEIKRWDEVRATTEGSI